ncbi:GntR family transcriptional regulator [Actibacterium sp. D379-3]
MNESHPVPGASSETMSTLVYRRLRSDILTCNFPPGSKLKIERLTDLYGVGASPTREALSRLSTENFVKRHEQKGFQVAPVSMEEFQELSRTRSLLGKIILAESIERGDVAWEEQIILAESRLRRTPQFTETGEMHPDWARNHKSYHMAMVASCGSRWLLDFSENLFDCMDRYRVLALKAGAENRDAQKEHRDLMEAVLDRDVDTAVRLQQEHMSATARAITGSQFNKIDFSKENALFARPR